LPHPSRYGNKAANAAKILFAATFHADKVLVSGMHNKYSIFEMRKQEKSMRLAAHAFDFFD